MLLPIIIFLMILAPVLIPAAITAVDAIARWQPTYPRRMPSRRLAVAAA
jgi:hypothetical protein